MPFSRTVCVVSESIHTDHMEGHNLKFQGERCVFCFCLFFVVVVVIFFGGGRGLHAHKKEIPWWEYEHFLECTFCNFHSEAY